MRLIEKRIRIETDEDYSDEQLETVTDEIDAILDSAIEVVRRQIAGYYPKLKVVED
jgi:hypothetical protein